MTDYYAMVVHRATIAGRPTGSLDVSTYFYRAVSESDVRSLIESSQPLRYVGGEGDDVTWELVRILSIDECHSLESGDEVTGLITSNDELAALV